MANKKKKKKTIPDQIQTWKPPFFKWMLVLVGCGYAGLLIGCNYRKGETIFDVIARINSRIGTGKLLNIGLADGIKQFDVLAACFIGCIFLGCLYILIDASANHNYMRGKEFGTAQWASVDAINAKFENRRHESWNRVYSDELRISMKTSINNNCLVIGGSGVGKSFYLLTPNIYQADPKEKYPGSYIFTDPKGELLLKNGAYLKNKGYRIRVLNLVSGAMQESDCFNPLIYIRQESDIDKLVRNIQDNTNEDSAAAENPFWPKAEALLLKSLFLIVWMESDLFGWEMNIPTVCMLLNKAQIDDDPNIQSELDQIFDELVLRTVDIPGKGEMHPAWRAYHKVMVGAADTKRSIVISAHATMQIFENPDIQRILSKDELELSSIGTGLVDGKKNVKTALFCVIPDSDTTFNAVAGMLYTLLFQELYFQADFCYKGKLPVPVTFWMDEFANICLPKDFMKMLTTMRSRLISCVIIIQNLAQIKERYKESWEEIPGNCDVCVYLGGNEQSTFEYISKNLGKKTIYKKSSGETKGIHGSSSTNEDSLGRELMLPEEVRELDNDFCVVFVRGKKPILDHKFKTLESQEFELSNQLGTYLHSQDKQLDRDAFHISLASQKELSDAYALGRVIEINLDQNILNTAEYQELQDIVLQNSEDVQEELERAKTIDIRNVSLMDLLQMDDFVLSDEEMVEVAAGIKGGLSDEEVKSYILYGDAHRMHSQRLLLEALATRRKAGGGSQ